MFASVFWHYLKGLAFSKVKPNENIEINTVMTNAIPTATSTYTVTYKTESS